MLTALLALSACETPFLQEVSGQDVPDPGVAPAQTLAAAPPPPPPQTARTVADFDTTSASDRAEAVAVLATAADQALGTTLATLGSPAEPGIWLKTPLVTRVQQGKVSYQGRTINIELRPSGGAAGSGSQISLAAMRLLEAPLTAIVPLSVTAANG
ncbi:D-galactarate dehydratase [Yoonia sp.]|uniref:D-galactarate dehydratase n=1 Tax=Yoonia sp. TaxID=2212373 RepID=UPI002FD917BA